MALHLMALGTLGDVVPHVAVAIELGQQGVDCAVAALPEHEAFVKSYGVRYERLAGAIPVDGNPKESLNVHHRPMYATTGLDRWQNVIAEPVAESIDNLVKDGDSIVVGTLLLESAAALVAERNVKAAYVSLAPALPTAQGVSLINAPNRTETTKRNRSWSTMQWPMTVAMSHPVAAALRARLGLPPLSTRGAMRILEDVPVLLAFSKLFVPPADDWGPNVFQTGPWNLPPKVGFQPSQALEQFLANGPKPVYLGFGTKDMTDFDEEFELFTSAARGAGQRLLMRPGKGGGEEGLLAEDVYLVRSTPHTWLFPQSAAVVSHGGPGTVAAALRAAVPQAIVPHDFDNNYYGQRANDLGVAPPPLARKDLTVETLTELVKSVTTGPQAPSYREAAVKVAAQLGNERGARNAAQKLRELGLLDS